MVLFRPQTRDLTPCQPRRRIGFPIVLLIAAAICYPRAALSAASEPDFEAIDRHAMAAPAEAEHTLAGLAAYLCRPAKDEREKARALYRWITANIVYDTKGFFAGQVAYLSPEAVLAHRTAVCDGFASLFQALAQAAGLNAVIIKGYAKGFGYLPGTGFREPPNHTWNAVQLDGRWYLLDATMGSGYINRQRQLVRQFRAYYFLTPPEAFIHDHFPMDTRWQLLDPPLTRRAFEELVWLKPSFFNHDLRLLSHHKATIACDNQALVALQAPATALVLARLEADNRLLDERYTFVQRHADKVDVHVKLPRKGRYLLRVYVKPKGLDGKYKSALDYVVQASGGAGDNSGFPKTYAPFNEYAVHLFSPMDGYLDAGRKENFKLAVPEAEKVAVVIGSEWHYLRRAGTTFDGVVPIPKGSFGVFAKFPGQTNFQALLDFTGR